MSSFDDSAVESRGIGVDIVEEVFGGQYKATSTSEEIKEGCRGVCIAGSGVGLSRGDGVGERVCLCRVCHVDGEDQTTERWYRIERILNECPQGSEGLDVNVKAVRCDDKTLGCCS